VYVEHLSINKQNTATEDYGEDIEAEEIEEIKSYEKLVKLSESQQSAKISK
jgi:hypothetical protein